MKLSQKHIPLPLAMGLIMFPQIIEALYSPALTSISHAFHVSAATASQTLSVFFFAFAVGVFFWGRLCDHIGRRPTMLLGLLIYLIGCMLSLLVSNFHLLLGCFAISAFGAAVGSVVTQTMIRDGYHGNALSHLFSLIGMCVAVSPVIGLMCGGFLTDWGGYWNAFLGLAIFATILYTLELYSVT